MDIKIPRKRSPRSTNSDLAKANKNRSLLSPLIHSEIIGSRRENWGVLAYADKQIENWKKTGGILIFPNTDNTQS